MQKGTALTIKNAINDFIDPLIQGYTRIGDTYTAGQLQKAKNQINKAISEEGITE